jgi:DNA helicase-2/ATP-dependent DNA helicase PcrA
MSDASVHAALRSDAKLVVVEAPAGCGKTYQGAEYAVSVAPKLGDGRLLILAHTHAAVDVFAARTTRIGSRVEIRTIDSLISQVAAAYHSVLGLPADPGIWVRERENGHALLAAMAATLLSRSPIICQALVHRYPVITCDEHQDASADQHAIVTALHRAGAAVRIFADPMQYIFGSKKAREMAADLARWETLKAEGQFEELDTPHRWAGGSEELGAWILKNRNSLQTGGSVDLTRALPPGVNVIIAENEAQRHGGYQPGTAEGRQIRRLITDADALLILSRQNATVAGLRAFSGRQVPIWEGHTRDALSSFVTMASAANDDPAAMAHCVVNFMGSIGVGFTPSAFGNALAKEVADGCSKARRGKPATIQALARVLLEQPNHKGACRVLDQIGVLSRTDTAFQSIEIDHAREFREAVRLADFDDLQEGFGEITLRRTHARPTLPPKAISTVHKAKGFERENVLIVPCDKAHFPDNLPSRCALYVAMSRARRTLTFVVSRASPSPLITA